MTMDSSTSEGFERHGEDFRGLLRALLKTDLVVRVEDAGDYTVEYTDASGNVQTVTTTPMPVRPKGEPISLALSSAGKLTDGVKPYVVSSTSGRVMWDELMLTLDGTELYMAYAEDGACPIPAEGEYAFCRDGAQLMPYEMIAAGDELVVAAAGGERLRVLDSSTNAVILSLVVR